MKVFLRGFIWWTLRILSIPITMILFIPSTIANIVAYKKLSFIHGRFSVKRFVVWWTNRMEYSHDRIFEWIWTGKL